MNMPLLNKVFKGILLLGIIVLAVLVFQGEGHLKTAKKQIGKMQGKISQVEDSLVESQAKLSSLLIELRKSEIEIQTLKTEREILEIEIQKEQAKNRKELEEFRIRILALEERKKKLQEEAKKYDL